MSVHLDQGCSAAARMYVMQYIKWWLESQVKLSEGFWSVLYQPIHLFLKLVQ